MKTYTKSYMETKQSTKKIDQEGNHRVNKKIH